jgi:hypothetical protein
MVKSGQFHDSAALPTPRHPHLGEIITATVLQFIKFNELNILGVRVRCHELHTPLL